jgi:hypothetical protein
MSAEGRELRGPIDDADWPDKLTARVVAPGPTPRLLGYDIEEDLARHYSFAETTLLSLTGELPSPAQARAFEVALHFLSPASVNEAPTHAAVVARICNVLTSAVTGTAAIGLAEQARHALAAHANWWRHLESGEVEAVAEWTPRNDDERRSVQRLREALRGLGVEMPILDQDLGRTAALLATLRFAGLTRTEQLEATFVIARLPSAIAEALATPSHSYRDYPVDLPPVRYAEAQ